MRNSLYNTKGLLYTAQSVMKKHAPTVTRFAFPLANVN